jgi:ABC-2 type transport system permease protein
LGRLSFIMAILKKDLLDSLKTKTVLFIVISPILLSLVFRIALNPQQASQMKLALVDMGSSNIMEYIRKNSLGTIEIIEVDEQHQAKRMVQEGKVHAALVVPVNFDRNVKEGKSPGLDFWVDRTNISSAVTMEAFLTKLIYHYNNQTPPAQLVIKPISGANFQVRAAFIPTWLLFSVLGGYAIVSASLIEERERKTLQAVLTTPCRISEFLIGKGLTGFILTFISAMLVLGLNYGFIGNVSGNIVIVALGIIFLNLLGIMTGLLLQGQTSSNSFGAILNMLLLLPVVMADTNRTMNLIARFLPSYYIFNGANRTMFFNDGFNLLIPHFLYLVTGIIILFAVNTHILRTRESF